MLKLSMTLPRGIMAMSDETKKKIRESRTGPGIPLDAGQIKELKNQPPRHPDKNRQERMG
jgi:hypothetical protein